MTKLETFRPFAWGAVTGGIALTIAAFSADWIVTRGTHDQNVRTAWIDGQAAICATLAQTHRKATNDASDLQGYSAREARETLAKNFAVVLAGQPAVDQGVVHACSNLLDKRGT